MISSMATALRSALSRRCRSAILARRGPPRIATLDYGIESASRRAGSGRANNHHQFTPSPFARRSTIRIGDGFVVHRQLREGAKTNGVRRYLLLPRDPDGARVDFEVQPPSEGDVVASLHANGNVLFGARLHVDAPSADDATDDAASDYDEYARTYLAACGSLLDVAREDAAVDGRQVQALSTLGGLSAWVRDRLDDDGAGSPTLTGLLHGDDGGRRPPPRGKLKNKKEATAPLGRRAGQRIGNASSPSHVAPRNEEDRIATLEAIRAIATGVPRPGHSVVGMGTYRDGRTGWTALAREYAMLATATTTDDASAGPEYDGPSSFAGRRGLEEVALYASRGGEVTSIEHLAHTTPEYLADAGGAMARLFFC